MKSMTYFTAPSAVAYALLFAGIMFGILSVALTSRTVTTRLGSPMSVEDRLSHRIAGLTGAALLIVGAIPLLWAPAAMVLDALQR
jgi:hypothetical protein